MQYFNQQKGNKGYLKIVPSSVISLLLILAGLVASGYLFKQYLELNAGAVGTHDVCSSVFGKSCDNALKSSYSNILGLPLAAWSMVYYAAIVLFWISPVMFGVEFKKTKGILIFAVTLAGFAAALVLLAIMFINPEVFCPICTIIHGINIALFFFINRSNGVSLKDFSNATNLSFHIIFSKKIFQSFMRWQLFGLSAIFFLLISICFGLYTLVLDKSRDSAMIDANQIFNAFYSQPQLTIPIETDDPINGKEQSLIQIVVFSDFFCPACKRFSRDLKKIIEEGKGTYSIIFKHFPLSSDCNHGIQQNLHPFACQAAYASVIAQMQGKFWALHDSLFEAKNLNNIELIRISAMRAGLESKYFDSLMQSEKVKEKVSRDIALARSLNIDATPTVYLNGRLVKDMRRGILEILVHQELKKHQNERQYSPKKIHK